MAASLSSPKRDAKLPPLHLAATSCFPSKEYTHAESNVVIGKQYVEKDQAAESWDSVWPTYHRS